MLQSPVIGAFLASFCLLFLAAAAAVLVREYLGADSAESILAEAQMVIMEPGPHQGRVFLSHLRALSAELGWHCLPGCKYFTALTYLLPFIRSRFPPYATISFHFLLACLSPASLR